MSAQPSAVTSEQTRPVGGRTGGFRPAVRRQRARLPFRVELSRQLQRRRTQVVFALLAALPFILAGAFTLGDSGNADTFVARATSSGANFALFSVFVTATFLDVVLVALFFGDTVASEANWSSLRYLLAVPVPRGRLLAVKACVAALLSAAGLLVLPAIAFGLGSLLYGGNPLRTPFGSELDPGPGAARIAVAVGYLGVHLLWVAGLALLLSVSMDSPLGAVGTTVLIYIVFSILNQISALDAARPYLPENYILGWVSLFSPVPDWSQMAWGTFTGLAYGMTFALLAAFRFARRDIVS